MISDKEKIEIIIRNGYISLSESLYQYWPLPDDDYRNEISEGNLNIHLAHSLLNKGYSVFSEYRLNEREHYDLKAVSQDKSHEIIIECKRFLKTDSTSVSNDITRMLKSERSDKPVFGAVALFTQSQDIHDWWISEDRDALPSSSYSSQSWSDLKKLLDKNHIYCASFPMSYHGRDDFYHMGLYGIFNIHS